MNSRGYNRADYYSRSVWETIWRSFVMRVLKYTPVSKCKQEKINKFLYVKEDRWENVFPTLMPNWDRSARSGRKARIYTNSTPEVFKEQMETVLDLIKCKKDEHKITFLMSWNEWAEGNYVEPDLKYGHGFLNVIKEMTK